MADGGAAVVLEQLASGIDRNRFKSYVVFDTDVDSDIRRRLKNSDVRVLALKVKRNPHAMIQKTNSINKGRYSRINDTFGEKAGQFYLALKDGFNFFRIQSPKVIALIRMIRKHHIDLVHTQQNLHTGKAEIAACAITGVPCISHTHGYYPYSGFDKLFSKFVHTFIFISKHVAEFSYNQGISPSKGVIIHNGIDTDPFNQTYNHTEIREEFNCTPEQALIGIIGRLDSWKGHEYFIEAMGLVLKMGCKLKGLIVGGVETNVAADLNLKYFNKLNSIIQSNGLEEHIHFTGFRSDIPRIVNSLDIVVHASSSPEPFGLVVIEGMAAGKPVIATAAGGILDIIKDGEHGLLVPCKDSLALAKAIRYLLKHKNEAKKMGQAARSHVSRKFTVQRQIRTVEKLYEATVTT